MRKIDLLTLIIIVTLSFSLSAQEKATKPSNVKKLKDYSFIPQGKARFEKKEFEVNAFFISKYEVSNEQYREFLDSLKKNNETDKLKYAQIDSTQWSKIFNSYNNQPLVDNYSWHPAYSNYPVVNISYEAAILYCQWFTEKFNRNNKNNGIYYEFSLPTKQQWIRAARGNNNTEYAWRSPRLLGEIYYCNFRNLNSENIHLNPKTGKYEIVETNMSIGKGADITAPVKSYIANQFEIYNMCGNVAEMIAEKGTAIGGSWNDTGYDVRVESTQDYKSALPFIGFRPIMTLITK
jgi:formylglycine-generating enzyme required for sulfatase activity